jgi:hypothetical protein
MNTQPVPPTTRTPTSHVIIYAALLAALVGSFLPWARVWFITVNGTDGDGVITAATSLVALGFFFGRNRTAGKVTGLTITAFVFSAIAAIVYVYDIINISSLASASDSSDEEFFDIAVTPQFGLIMGAAGAIVATVLLTKLLFFKPKSISDPAP